MQKLLGGNNTVVLDTHALMGYLYEEIEYITLRRYFAQSHRNKIRFLFNEINLGELLYRVWKNSSSEIAHAAISRIVQLPIQLVPVDQAFIMAAAKWKAQYAISYADAFVVETAVRNACPIITGDPEFDAIETIDIIRLGKKQ